MKKFILKLDLHDDKEKRKALKTVSSLPGIDSISMDMKEKKLTVIGTVDPVSVVSKLRKFWPADIIIVGPAKEPEKKEEAKKEEPKKEEEGKKDEEGKKEEPKKEEEKKEVEETKTEETKKEEEKKKDDEAAIEIMPYRPYYPPASAMPYRPYYPQMSAMPYKPYNPPMNTYYHINHSMEENPNACVIC